MFHKKSMKNLRPTLRVFIIDYVNAILNMLEVLEMTVKTYKFLRNRWSIAKETPYVLTYPVMATLVTFDTWWQWVGRPNHNPRQHLFYEDLLLTFESKFKFVSYSPNARGCILNIRESLTIWRNDIKYYTQALV